MGELATTVGQWGLFSAEEKSETSIQYLTRVLRE